MNKEDKKLQKHLVEEMMKVSKTNPDVMYYMESLMEYCLKIEKENNKQKEVLDKIRKNNARIIDYGFDYDGFNNVEDLKKLIDMLVDYARKNNELLEEIE